MRIAFSTGRPAHVALPANLLIQRKLHVTLFTASYRSRFQGLAPEVQLRWVPQFVPSIHFLTGIQLPRTLQRADTVLYDRLVASRIEAEKRPFDLFWGWASGALFSARAAHRDGTRFILDRACPHVDTQQSLVRQESDRLGIRYQPEPAWFRDRQLAEYEEADVILVPSRYSLASFPPQQQSKILVAPLFGRVPAAQAQEIAMHSVRSANRPFTFGTVGGQPLRKGFLYLLQAWQQLQLPNAQLLLRTDARLNALPALHDLLKKLPNVEVVGYVENMSDFYRRCDAFVFPTVDDGFGMALLEAMAHGLPAITTDHCGAAELFQASRDLLSVAPQDSVGLAEAMEKIYTSSGLRDKLRTNGLSMLRQIEGQGLYGRYTAALDTILADAKCRNT